MCFRSAVNPKAHWKPSGGTLTRSGIPPGHFRLQVIGRHSRPLSVAPQSRNRRKVTTSDMTLRPDRNSRRSTQWSLWEADGSGLPRRDKSERQVTGC